MNVKEILNNKKNLIDFLILKGFEEIDFIDNDYNNGNYFKITERKILVLYQITNENELKEIKDHFLIDRGLSYCIIRLDKKLFFFRNFGESKHFYYSQSSKNNSSKIDKLEKIDDSLDILFQSKDISKKFYESFKNKRNLVVQNILNDIDSTKKFLLAQKIFDRVFFIYFLCHKNIIKFEDGRGISGKNLFTLILEEDNFLVNINKLFDLFNNQNENILEINDFNLVIPYLNGGLFRLENIEYELNISLNKDQWKDIFEFLNSYHWIIEDVKVTEGDMDKVLTPEILGHVYERSVVEWEIKGFSNLAEEVVDGSERKKKGVYYTPESITDYISKKTVIPLLLNRIGNKYASFDDLIESNDIESIKRTLEVLNNIKILDPACGSGAFLTKVAELIFGLKRRLYYALNEKKDLHDLKLEIITDNIYGVDILSGAVEISHLRLWLWLIAHYDVNHEVEPLPNIEYNVICGNSLLGYEKHGKHTLRRIGMVEKIEEFEKIKIEYKRCHTVTSDIIRTVLKEKLDSLRSELNELFIEELNYKGIDFVKVKKDTQINFYGKKTEQIKYIYKKEFEEKFEPFHWILEFSEVFKDGRTGFDIIIGNPPYGNLLESDEKGVMAFYETIKTNEIAANFIERCLSLLNENSYFGQIITNAIAINKSLSVCRDLLRKNFLETYMALFNTRPIKIFDDAEVRVMIMISQKVDSKNGEIFTTEAIKLTTETREKLDEIIKFESVTGLELGNKKIGDGTDTALPKVGLPEIKTILKKLKQKSNITFSDIMFGDKYSLELRTTGRYWLIALDNFPYHNHKVKKIYFSNEVERDFALILINSSLFYLFWSTYGNLRDFSVSLLKKFPCPTIENLNENRVKIKYIKNNLNKCLIDNHDFNKGQSGVGEFSYSKCKNLMDDADVLISMLYGLDEILLEFIINYDHQLRPNNL